LHLVGELVDASTNAYVLLKDGGKTLPCIVSLDEALQN